MRHQELITLIHSKIKLTSKDKTVMFVAHIENITLKIRFYRKMKQKHFN